WPSFQQASAAPLEQPVGVLVKIKLAEGHVGVMLALTTPRGIFGQQWMGPHRDFARVVIRDHETQEVVGASVDGGAAPQGGIFPVVPVVYTLQTGKRLWDIQFDVMPTSATRFLVLSPWMAAVFVLM